MEETANNNITTETTATTEVVKSEPVQESKEVSYSQEQFDKAIQSANSKGKNEILKELGISNVSEFKTLKETYDTAIKEKETLESQVQSLSNKLSMQTLGVKEDLMDDFLVLAQKRVSDTVTLEQSFEEVAKAYPNMLKDTTPKDVKTGIEKKEGSKSENQYSEDMLKRYPWLKNNKKI